MLDNKFQQLHFHNLEPMKIAVDYFVLFHEIGRIVQEDAVELFCRIGFHLEHSVRLSSLTPNL